MGSWSLDQLCSVQENRAGPSATCLPKFAFILSGAVTPKLDRIVAHPWRCLSVRCSLEVGLRGQKAQEKRLLYPDPDFQRPLYPRRAPLIFWNSCQAPLPHPHWTSPNSLWASTWLVVLLTPLLSLNFSFPHLTHPSKQTLSYIVFDLSVQRYQIVFTLPLFLCHQESVSLFSWTWESHYIPTSDQHALSTH